MKITIKKVSDLKRPDRNVRLHGDKQIKEYVRSIKMFGQVRPLVIDENNVVLCGNGLLQALQAMEVETADCYIVKNLSENDKKKLMLADNKIFELGVNATDTFDAFIRELDGDIDIPGYDEEMLKILTANAKEADAVLNDYGKFSEPSINRMEQAPSPESFNDSSVNNESNNGENSAGTPISVNGSNTPIQSTQGSQKFLICPKCGEKIWL